jgi:aminoglycoside/choline kinase family phosphotransferase/GTP:adenosylcobinamide-phosphate guanylyltransferase
MIALVLAAGFGTRLRPYSQHTPKPLFTLNRQPLLDIILRRLLAADARTIIVNTHHHHRQIEDFVHSCPYADHVVLRHEPEILGTGGAIRNTADIWHPHPLLVVNSDIYTDLDYQAFYRFHRQHGFAVSLALCDHPEFNSVRVDDAQRVVGFDRSDRSAADPDLRRMTFTGVQVLNDELLAYIPSKGYADSIDAYAAMIDDGLDIAAYIPRDLQWSDLGTPERYQAVAREIMAVRAVKQVTSNEELAAIDWQPLKGDGSERRWFRVGAGKKTLIVADHGIKPSSATCEAESFVAIARHLFRKGLPVPSIIMEDTFAGLVVMEDLGTLNLQTYIQRAADQQSIDSAYRRLIDLLIGMSFRGGEGFDPGWTCQTPRYDHEVVLQLECRYFVEAFLQGFLGEDIDFEMLAPECSRLADMVAAVRPLGFMHRDFQSRNIMVHNDRFYLIDFQGGRLGPPHYDLASLIIDPYVDLPVALRESLLDYFCIRLAERAALTVAEASRAYRYCALARNLQILGAYGYLTRRRGKPFFAQFIPAAARSLRENLSRMEENEFPLLCRIANKTIPRHLSPSQARDKNSGR